MSRVLHIVLNGYTNDNRVRRAAECGADMNFEVRIFALAAPGYPENDNRAGVDIHRFDLSSRSWSKAKVVQLFKYSEVAIRMIIAGSKFKPTIVHAHDLDALPIGYVVAAITGSKLIYDAHELWADSARDPSTPKWLVTGLALVERIFVRQADVCITVSESIAQHMAENQNIRTPVVIRNVPERWPEISKLQLRDSLGIPSGKLVVLHQGVIDDHRVMTLVQAFRKVNGNAVLVFLGDGPAVVKLQTNLADLSDRVLFHPLVPSEELPSFTCDADIGIHPMTAGCLNHLWALPNKLFEYIQGGLAVITTELPEMAKIVNNYGVGLTFPPSDSDSLARCLQLLIDDTNLRNKYRRASHEAAVNHLNWTIEKELLKNIYRTMS